MASQCLLWTAKQSVFFSKSVKKSVKRGVRVFPRVPDLLFDCSCVLEYAKIRTVLQSRSVITKCDKYYLQSKTGITMCDNFITKCEKDCKVVQVVQSATIITK